MMVYAEIEPRILKYVFPILKDYLGWQHWEGQACLLIFVSPTGKRNLFINF